MAYSDSQLEIGSFYQKISIKFPSMLTGHINRNQAANSFLDYPELHTIIIRKGTSKIVLISIDLLEMDTQISLSIRDKIAQVLDISPSAILIACTHAHTLPAAIKLGLVEINKSFVESLESQILHSVNQANSSFQPCKLFFSQENCPGIGINRRLIVNGQVVMAPNPKGINDTKVLTYWFMDDEDKPLACLVNFNMHATVLDVSIFKVSADYPQYLRKNLQISFPNLNVLFFNGACGDIRPNLVHTDGSFRGGFEKDIKEIGKQLAESVLASLPQAEIQKPKINFAEGDIHLNYDYQARENAQRRVLEKDSSESKQINQELMQQAFDAWEKEVKETEKEGKKAYADFKVQAFKLSDKICILTLPGEIFVETGLNIKKKSCFPTTMIVGYSNGSIGYVPTKEACDLGGYEAQDAYKLYGHPAPFCKNTAQTIEDFSADLLRYLDK